MDSNRELHLMVSFDMESDIGSWTSEHKGVVEGTPRILDILAGRDIPCTFFFTGDAAQASPESVSAVKSAGHEVGCHTLHHESLGAPLFDALNVQPVLPEEVPNRVTKATELIEELSGVRPVSFRAPRGWASTEMMVTLDQLGYWVDSSYMVYYFGEHLLPYHPSANDWTRSGELNILEVPLFGDITVESADPYRRDRDQWPKLRLEGGRALVNAILRVAERLWAQGKPAIACLYLHPWEFVEMPRAVDAGEARIEFHEFLWKSTGAAALAELDVLVRTLQNVGSVFHTLRDFRTMWLAQHGDTYG